MRNTLEKLRESLSTYDVREVQSIIDLLLEEVCNISRVDRIMHPDLVLPEVQRQQLLDCADKLSRGIPVQQALGYEWFCGAKFKVTPDVLIPRPETAELVAWICEEATSPISILDIGTGSGCIALSLARLINKSQVLAIDLSTAALGVAKENCYQQGIDNAYFAQCDILRAVDNSYFETQINRELTTYPQGCTKQNQQELYRGYEPDKRVFNVIVSNPPYICQREKVEMSSVVLDHEPSLALFVPDEDPLLFYRTIAQFGREHLTDGGKLYFEINAAYGPETCEMLRNLGYKEVTLRQDINGRDRMVRAER